MPNHPQYDDPEFWQARAEEMRVVADRMTEIGTMATLFRIASDYDKLAERAEIRNSGGKPPE